MEAAMASIASMALPPSARMARPSSTVAECGAQTTPRRWPAVCRFTSASLRLQRLPPGERLGPWQVEGDVLRGAVRPIPIAAEDAGDHVALGLAHREEAGHDLRARRVIDAAGVAVGHHVFAEGAAESIDLPRHLDAPGLGVVRDIHLHELDAVDA